MMKIFLLLILSAMTLVQSQTFKKGIIVLNDGTELKVRDLNVEQGNQTVSFMKDGQSLNYAFDEINTVMYKKGNYWWAGMIGGLVGAGIANAIIRSGNENDEWWYGIGTSGSIGMVAGAISGIFQPRYKKLDIHENQSVEVAFIGNGFKINF